MVEEVVVVVREGMGGRFHHSNLLGRGKEFGCLLPENERARQVNWFSPS